MARVSKADHPKILQMVDGEGLKVSEVAASYGVTPAAMYALLGKLRRGGMKATPVVETPEEPEPGKPVPDLFAAAVAAAVAVPGEQPVHRPSPPAVVARPVVAAPAANVREFKPAAAARSGVGAKAAKPGFGLVMRTGDGEDSMTPFRSLDDLLSAVKPILRAAVRSPEAVWFSIQPVDLSTIELDVA